MIDDYSRVACAETYEAEKAASAIGVLHRAVSWSAARCTAVERVLSDYWSACRCVAWRDSCAACTELGIAHKRARPYRPQTTGKIGRLHRTLADGCAFSRQ